MSTKIYDGYKVECSTDPFVALESMRLQANETLKNLLVKVVALSDTYKQVSEDPELNYSPVWTALQRINRHECKALTLGTGTRFDLQVRFVFSRNKTTGELYVFVQSEQPDYARDLVAKGLIKEYFYWDNSEGPDDMTEEQWDARGQEWDEIIGRNGCAPVTESGLVWNVIGSFYSPRSKFKSTAEAHELAEQWLSQSDAETRQATYLDGIEKVMKTHPYKDEEYFTM